MCLSHIRYAEICLVCIGHARVCVILIFVSFNDLKEEHIRKYVEKEII